MNDPTGDTIHAALARFDIAIPESQIQQLDRYSRLLWTWNEKINLTRHTDYDRFVSRDLVDCLQLSQLLPEAEQVLDVGSGGGVPGLALAILRPDLDLTLAESVGKKATALEDLVNRLELDLPVLARRAEHVLAERRFECLIARAVGPQQLRQLVVGAHAVILHRRRPREPVRPVR